MNKRQGATLHAGKYIDNIQEEDSDKNVNTKIKKITPIIKILFDHYYRDIRK